MSAPTPAEIAAKLSPAQRDGLTRRPCPSWYEGPPASFPASVRTAWALWNRGLVLGHGSTRHKDTYALTPLGLAVRAELEKKARHE